MNSTMVKDYLNVWYRTVW